MSWRLDLSAVLCVVLMAAVIIAPDVPGPLGRLDRIVGCVLVLGLGVQFARFKERPFLIAAGPLMLTGLVGLLIVGPGKAEQPDLVAAAVYLFGACLWGAGTLTLAALNERRRSSR